MLPEAFKAHSLLVIGHRGSPLRAPENTLISFKKALEEGVQGIEFDVRLSQDHEVLVFHDEKVDRLTEGKGLFRNYTSKALCALELGTGWGMRDIRIPLLREVLERFGRRCALYVELKADHLKERDRVLARKTMELLDESGLIQNCVLISFDYTLVKWIKQDDRRFFTGFNFSKPQDLDLPRRDGYKYLDGLCPKSSCLSSQLMKEAASHQLSILTWVVNDLTSLRKALKLGVQGIATDDPRKIANYVSRIMNSES
jgi:glycerophosphoryl diester phosphodiesterase